MKCEIKKLNGCKMIYIDGKPFLPAAYRSFRPTPSNIALFHRCGVKLYQMICSGRFNALGIPYSNFGGIWVGHNQYDFSAFDRQMKMFMRFAPDGYFMVMIQLDMPDWWMDKYGRENESFDRLGEAVLCQKWIDEAGEYLKAFIRYAEKTYGNRIFGYSYACGNATEWFNKQKTFSDAKLSAYRKYANDDKAVIPSYEQLLGDETDRLRSPNDDAVKYFNFSATLTPDLICHFANEAQKVLNHEKLIALFFGYTDMPANWQTITDTNGYEKVWADDNIDILLSPASYKNSRDLDGASSYQYLVDSVAVNDKLYLHEIDHRTYLAGYPLDNFFSLENEAYETEYETIMVLRRELCAAAVKDGALWWFDFTGNYYASPELEQELIHELDVLERLYKYEHKSVSQIAVFADPMNFLYLPDRNGISMDYVRHNRDSLHMCGAPYDYYNMKDITKIDLSQYKTLVFLNTFEMSEQLCSFIKENTGDKLKIWLHAPNYIDKNGFNEAGIEDITGIKVTRLDADYIEQIEIDGNKFGFEKIMNPLFEVVDENAEIIGKYVTRGSAAAAIKNDNVYIGTGNVPADVFAMLAKKAGVHMYSSTGCAFYADSRFVARQTVHETECEINMPFDCEFEELFDGGVYKTENRILRYTAEKGATKLFLITKRM